MERAAIEAQVAAYLAEMVSQNPSDAYAGTFVGEHASHAIFSLRLLLTGEFIGGYSYLIFDQNSYEIKVFGSGSDFDAVVEEIDRKIGYIPDGDDAFIFLTKYDGSAQDRPRYLRIIKTLRCYCSLDQATPWTSMGIHLEIHEGKSFAIQRLNTIDDAKDECVMSLKTAVAFIARLATYMPPIAGIMIVDSRGRRLVFAVAELENLLAERES